MIKLLAGLAAAALFLSPGAGVSLGPEGVRIAGAPVDGSSLDLRETEQGTLLVSSACVEPVTAAIEVSVADAKTLVLEPGVRAQKAAAGLILSVHNHKWVRLEASGVVLFRKDSILVKPAEAGWDCGDGRVLTGPRLLVSVQQDDPDKNLEEMERAARRLEEAIRRGVKPPDRIPPDERQPRTEVRRRRIFSGDPTVGSEQADSGILRRISEASPAGF